MSYMHQDEIWSYEMKREDYWTKQLNKINWTPNKVYSICVDADGDNSSYIHKNDEIQAQRYGCTIHSNARAYIEYLLENTDENDYDSSEQYDSMINNAIEMVNKTKDWWFD